MHAMMMIEQLLKDLHYTISFYFLSLQLFGIPLMKQKQVRNVPLPLPSLQVTHRSYLNHW